jgi:uncharacterized glyoxalase superfamily protein PhnB
MKICYFKWQLMCEKVTQFKNEWMRLSNALKRQGNFSVSPLLKGNDGMYYAHIHFYDEAIVDALLSQLGSEIGECTSMQEAIIESFPHTVLEAIEENIIEPETFLELEHAVPPLLNQVTLGCTNVIESKNFYLKLGLRLIVSSDHYCRFECPNGGSTLSIHLVPETESVSFSAGCAAVYFEHPRLEEWVEELKKRGIVFETEITNQTWRWKEIWLKDPFGHRICLYTAGKNRRFPPWRVSKNQNA